ncbi:uncharacterized protein SAPINGB_P001599 [Magnusiomyces paraingens]|uniref:Uncharacterized protein n=1 Tax=Magnusiomyces paraingens TaxID=2606893 RepID=A0A5E8B757_9ASCO|nr:uncharacterized protein SAPINGB_P001599 [Saprochaete ingens]VVT47213.1 unnamed protein product [Saprochaete ingens]
MSSSSSSASTQDPVSQTLAQYTPCDVADALVKYGIPHGGYIPHLVQYSKTLDATGSVAGRAYTVEYAPLDDPRPAVKGGYIDTAPAGGVVVLGTSASVQIPVAPYTRISNALYGGLMSTRAQYRGAVGSVVLGKIRDVREHNALGYPVFAYGLGICAPTKVVKVVAVDAPLVVKVASQSTDAGAPDEERVINPGDYIVADENGVVVLPAADEEFVKKVLEAIPPRVRADELVAEDIKQGVPAGQAQKHRRAGL